MLLYYQRFQAVIPETDSLILLTKPDKELARLTVSPLIVNVWSY